MAASTRITITKAALETLVRDAVAEALAAQAPAPVQSAPAKAKAESSFVGFLRERAAAKVACEIHAAGTCNRRFSPKSSGRQSHVARVE
ncbi:MAG TPA: hypothetical protein VFW03_09120 [Gemmatimonadaceae bacterium]|nr:hypothetical protein [Gemmatimonadaceae bacterium]